MEMTAKDIELELYRSGLLKSSVRAALVTRNAKALKAYAARYDRARLQLRNGIERWNAQAGRVVAELTEKDQDRLEATLEKAQAAMVLELQEILKRGARLDFRRDPRGAICRFVNRANTRDGWIS